MTHVSPVVRDKLYPKLVRAFFFNRLKTIPVIVTGKKERPSSAELSILLSEASALTLRECGDAKANAECRGLAYDICTKLVQLYPELPQLKRATYSLLSRMGNFPARRLLLDNGWQREASGSDLLGFESDMRENENTLVVDAQYAPRLTDFQVELAAVLAECPAVSVSAPTSAGKSFILLLDIVRRLKPLIKPSIVYIVPTRALIRQVTGDLIETFRACSISNVLVLTAPTIVDEEAHTNGVVYVLTAERMMSLLFPPEGTPRVDVLIVDEAHELGDEERGMVLHSAIQITRQKFPRCEVIFSSPLTSNPRFLLNEFGLNESGQDHLEFVSPVSQTLIYLNKVSKESSQAEVELFSCGQKISYGPVALTFPFRAKRVSLASAAVHFTNQGETSIIYSNGKVEAETLATLIAAQIDSPADTSPEIRELMSFIREHIHEDYLLLDLLPKGIAYHYGQMPSIVRNRIEALAKDNQIRFICCTSTLLQGVNLPAKNIFIQCPRKGNENPLEAADFWNLAGRAGRLSKNFSGNVWCLDVKEWKIKPNEDDRYAEITSAFRQTLQTNPDDVLTASKDQGLATTGSAAEQAFSKVFSEFTLLGKDIASSQYATVANSGVLASLDQTCRALQSEIHLPRDILEKNASISPWCLERLYKRFDSAPDINEYIPKPPLQSTQDCLRMIFKNVDEVFLNTANDTFGFYGWIGSKWIQGMPMTEILKLRITNKKAVTKPAKNDVIRKVFEVLEVNIHFQYVKYTRAYLDILRIVLLKKGHTAVAERLAPFHIFLEFGSADKVTLEMMSLGLSRTTAILLKGSVGKRWASVASREELRVLVSQTNLAKYLPALCVREIAELLGLAVRV